MTISSTTRKAGPFTGDTITVSYPFDFKVFKTSDVSLIRLTVSSGLEDTLVQDLDYTVALNANQNTDPGGTITLTAPLGIGYTLTITSVLSYLQPTDLTNQGGFYPSVITDSLDRATIFAQQLNEDVSRTLKISVTTPAGVTTKLPAPAANKVISWNAAGNALENRDAIDFATVVAYGSAKADIFTGDGSTVDFTLEMNPASINNLDVSVGGVSQVPTVDYNWTTGQVVTFTTAPPNGATVLIRYMQALPQGAIDWSSVTNSPFISSPVYITSTTTASLLGYTAIEVVKGGSFAIASGVTFTIDVPFSCGLTHCFTGGGSVVFGKSSIERILPQWFGATGDGTTDDTAAIQKAINTATLGSVYEIFFSPGRYICNSTLYPKEGNNFTLRGTTNLEGGGGTLVSHSTYLFSMSQSTGFTMFNFINMAFEGSDYTTSKFIDCSQFGIDGTNWAWSTMDSCYIVNFKEFDIVATGIHINNNNFQNIYAIRFRGADHNITNNYMANLEIPSSSKSDVMCSLAALGASVFSNNYLTSMLPAGNAPIPFAIEGSYNIACSSNKFDGGTNYSAVIREGAYGITFEKNSVGSFENNTPLRIQNCKLINVVNNRFSEMDAAKTYYIELSSDITDTVIANNIVSDGYTRSKIFDITGNYSQHVTVDEPFLKVKKVDGAFHVYPLYHGRTLVNNTSNDPQFFYVVSSYMKKGDWFEIYRANTSSKTVVYDEGTSTTLFDSSTSPYIKARFTCCVDGSIVQEVQIPYYPSYASNAAAISAGLAVGAQYRNGDNLCIVH